MASLRKEIEDLVYSVYNDLDPSGANTDIMKEKFKHMNDKEFFDFHKEITNSETLNYRYMVAPYDKGKKSSPQVKNAEKALKRLKVPLFERITLPHIYKDKNGRAVMSQHTFMVGPIHVNILQQQIFSEASVTTDETEVDSITGAVKGHSKGGKLSNTAIAAMKVRKTDNTITEMIRFRSDNPKARQELFNQIVNTGVATLSDKTIDVKDQRTKNYTNEIMLGMMLQSSLVDDIE